MTTYIPYTPNGESLPCIDNVDDVRLSDDVFSFYSEGNIVALIPTTFAVMVI